MLDVMPYPPHVPPELRSVPFLGSDAVRRGQLSWRQLDGPAWRRLWRDVYVHRDVPDDPRTRMLALGLVVPRGSVVSGPSAAWLHGADVQPAGAPVEVTVPRETRMASRRGVRIYRSEIEPEDVRCVARIRVTSPIRTAFDTARRPFPAGDPTEAVVVADALAHLELITPEQLAAYAEQSRFAGWNGVRKVAGVAAHVEPLSESPQESRLRMRLVRAGLPRPMAQLRIHTDAAVYRVDLAYPAERVAIDYDGECHATRREADAERHNRITAAGWTHFVVTKRMMGDPAVIDRVRAVLARAFP